MTQAKKRPASKEPVEGCCVGLSELLSPRLFKALADPQRLSLLARLAEAGEPCTVGQVAQGSSVDLSVVSRHLAVLREAGVIECVKRGKEVWCSVQGSAVAALLRGLADALEACCPAGARQEEAGDPAGPSAMPRRRAGKSQPDRGGPGRTGVGAARPNSCTSAQ